METASKKLTANNLALVEAYIHIHGHKPVNMEDWQIAQRIIEGINNPKIIKKRLKNRCERAIRNEIEYPSERRKMRIILDMEDIRGGNQTVILVRKRKVKFTLPREIHRLN